MSDQFSPTGQPENQSGADYPAQDGYTPDSTNTNPYQPAAPYSSEPAYTPTPAYPATPTADYSQPAYDPNAPQAAPAAPGAQPYYYPQPGQYGYQPVAPQPATDGLAIAALVTGVLGMSLIPLILGIISLNKIKKTGAGGRGMAIAGIVLGAITTIAYVILIIALIIGLANYSSSDYTSPTPGTSNVVVTQAGIDKDLADHPELQSLYDGCSTGDMGSCDELYYQSPFGSVLEAYADTCGGTTSGGMTCKD